jgi:hypothetical protein
MSNVNSNIIGYINDFLFEYTTYTIPYVYWWSTTALLYIGTVYLVMGLSVGGFCAA